MGVGSYVCMVAIHIHTLTHARARIHTYINEHGTPLFSNPASPHNLGQNGLPPELPSVNDHILYVATNTSRLC